ncbi:MAG: hypothetical protein JJ966_05670 [Balneolaceae bacterium]|nr:hypothetical protein [Balneolaceae bacterium]
MVKFRRFIYVCIIVIGCGSIHPITTVEHTDLTEGTDGQRINVFPAPVVESVGWRNLSSAAVDDVDEEFQIAIYSDRKPFHLFRISNSKKNPGGSVLFWPFDGSSDSAVPEENMREYLSTICEEFERVGPYEYCLPKFNSNNNWENTYNNLIQRNIWTMPDGSAFESSTTNPDDGELWGMVFQVRKGMYFRTFSHENPDLYNGTSEALDVLSVAAQLRLIANNFVPPINYNTYAGVTNGLRGSEFIPCGVNETWRFDANLTELMTKKGMPTVTQQQDQLLFQVKVSGVLRDEWYSNRRTTGFTKIITPNEVSEVRVVSDTSCVTQ